MRAFLTMLVCLVSLPGMAQTSPYYVGQGPTAYPEKTWVFQDGAQQFNYGWLQAGERLLYVDEDRVAQVGYYGTTVSGHEYALDGTPTGVTFTCEKGLYAYDIAFDGTFVYMLEYPTGLLVRYDADFSNRQEMFVTRQDEISVAYDSYTATVYTSNWNDEFISQWSLSGQLLGQWPSACPAGLAALAYDPQDGTLWGACNYVTYEHFRLMQFDLEGGLLQKVFRPYHFFLSGEIYGDYVKDKDGDGIDDDVDECLDTAGDEVVDDTGCSLDQVCPCDADWKSHGEYVTCMRSGVADFQAGGFMNKGQAMKAFVEAAKNGCGD